MKHYKKKDRSTLWVVVITILLTVLIIFGISKAEKNNQTSGNTKPSQLQTAENSYDFGSISMANGKVKKTFTFKNNTSEAIVAKKLYTSCMCTQATLTKNDKTFGPFGMPAHGFIPEINENIEPGQEAQIEVVFDPAAHGPAGVGPIERQATLDTSDGQLVFKFKAQVTP
ncbi:MAG: hypothetical protein US42_C0012G0013 [Candidatus Magasanikbacteria bacterium GW2011_GWC2_37_14]|uniref:PF07610 family protein n=1 Tax=Candidatus Magasanikbacteria bacterium GW2011_GWC2_37_14 TaxID=1619046 RepID=A0A0G0GBA8_9BACT|nr:MAG: hypothetical protein US42_C0012G0013 [Candidatus Magasanikbacteria bacterium GW2011_GWC2_37_14]